jgi:hypothetical protein
MCNCKVWTPYATNTSDNPLKLLKNQTLFLTQQHLYKSVIILWVSIASKPKLNHPDAGELLLISELLCNLGILHLFWNLNVHYNSENSRPLVVHIFNKWILSTSQDMSWKYILKLSLFYTSIIYEYFKYPFVASLIGQQQAQHHH